MNEYDSIAGELKQSELQGSLYAGARQQPDTEAKIQALAQRTGLPVDVVRIKQPEVELHDRLQSFDYERVIKESPKLSAWLADPKNAAVAHDDWNGLSRTEKLLTHGRDYAGALWQGTVGQGAGSTLSGLGQLNATSARSIERGLDYVLPDSAMKALKTPIPWYLNPTEILRRPGTALKQSGEAMAPPKERRTLGTDVVSGIGQLGFQIATFMATGGASSTATMYAQGADIMADKTAKDIADPALRDTAIIAGGAITALTERYGLDKILNRVPPAIKNRATRFIADKLAAGGIEAAQEATEGLLHDVTRRLTTNADAPMLQGVGQEMSAAAIAAGVVRTALGVRGFRQAQQTEQFVAALGEEAKSSKLRERLPDRYRELVERYTADGPVQNLMVPADRFAEYFQSAGMDPAQVAAETGAQNYDEALASGGDVVIPMAGFMSQIAPSDHLQGLMQDVRLAPYEMTAREAREAEANSDAQEKELRSELEGIDAAAKSGQAIDVAIQRVITDVEGQLLARYDTQTARTMATAMRGMAVLANRANPNMDPLEAAHQLWAKYGLTIQANPLPKVLTDAKDFDAVLDPMLDRLRTGKVPTDREIFGPSLFDFLREKGGIRDDGGELKYRDLEIWDRENRPKGARRLVNGDGLDFDRARELALEAGYDVGEDINSFLDALDRELDGRTVFSAVNENAELRGQAEGLDGLAKALQDMGLDLDADNATIRRALRGDEGEGYDQGAPTTLAAVREQWDAAGIRHAISENGGTITLSQIVVPADQREAGKGTDAMQALVDYADRTGQRVVLSPAPDFGGNKKRLIEFYKRFGFVENKGRSKDFTTMESMYREPRKSVGLNQDARGSIQISPDRRMKISLFEKADLSTFLHESGHFYLEVMGDLAEAAETDQQVRDDYAAILKFLGVANRSEIKVEHHEKFARANEAYLMEGKAPAPELAGVFQRFRAWMKLIYQQLATLNVTLTDDVRQVFDRIYATDAEIARAEADAGLQDLFIDAKAAGMTEAEFALYRDTVARTSEAGKEKLQTELMRVQKLKREAWWRDELAKTAEEVAAEYDASPAAQAAARMWAGERLNRRQLEQRYSKETLDRLPRSKQGRVYAPDGRDIDSLAEVMGFSNADDMVTALVQLPPRSRWIAAEANARMLERYGDLLNDVALSDEATAALHNAERERVIRIELRALNKKIREVAPFVKAERQKARDNRRAALAATETGSDIVTRRIAAGLVGQKEVRDLNPHQYVVAQRKANRAAFKAMASGDHAEAGIQKQRELLNHYLYLEARKAQQEADSIVKFLKPFTADKKRAELAKAGADYLDQIDGILERYEFKPATLRQMQRRESLSGWLDAQEAAGNAVAVPAEVQDDARRVNWRKANIDELRAVRDAVKNIAHLASMKNKLIRKGKAIEFDGVVTELVDALESSGLAPTGELAQPNDKGATLAQRAGRTWRKFDAAHIKMEQVVEWLDSGRVDGPWARYFFDLADHAQTMEFDLHREVTTQIEALNAKMPKAWRSSLLDRTAVRLPGMDAPLTRYTLLSIGMNMGNAQNLQRLQDGYGWSDSDLNLVRDTLTAEDWTFIQSTWDALELLWPHMAALEERMSGLPPEKVEAVPFEVAGLELRGGYFPLVYDPRFSQAGEKQANEAESVQNFVAQGYGRANTNRGATKARLDQFRAAVKLDYEQVVTSHLAKVIKDISHREAVIGINKILTVPTIKQGLIDRIGEQGYEQARKWLQTLVMDRADTLHQASGLGGLVMKARTNTAIVTMGWKISTMMAQFAGITPVLDLVRPRYLTQALVQSARHPAQTWAFVSEKSGEMRNRSNTIERDMKDALLRLRGEGGALADVRRTAFYLTALADRMVTMPAWLGGYKQALAEGMGEEDAVRAGDRAVRLSQGAGGSKDLAAVQRNNELMKLLTMYYTPFNVLYARLRDLGHQQAVNGIGYLPKAVARFTALVIIPAVLGDLLAGRGPDDDEDEAMWAARKILLYPVATVPVVRDLSGYMEAGLIEATGEGEMRFQPSYKLSPVVGAIEKIARVPGKLYDVSTGNKDADEVAWDIFETSGYVLGLPTAQPRITGEYLTDLLSGNADPENAAELMQGALFRRQKE